MAVRLQVDVRQAVLRRNSQKHLIGGLSALRSRSDRRCRWRARKLARLAQGLALLALMAQAGCSWLPSPSSLNPFSSKKSEGPAAACPTATILTPLAHTAMFAPGQEHNPIGVAFYGVLDDVSAKCQPTGGGVHVALNVVIIGERGPSARGGTLMNLNYFVAVTGPNDAILSKRTLPIAVAIPADKKRAGVTDHLEETIPLAGLTPGQLTIDIGFQQSPEVIDFYRHFRGD
jgi:hypothetical protein